MQKWEYLVVNPMASEGKSIGFSPNKVDVAPLINKYPIKFVNYKGEHYDDGREHLCHKSLRFRWYSEYDWGFDGKDKPIGLFQDFLDLIGLQGWEGYAVMGNESISEQRLYFKRPLPD